MLIVGNGVPPSPAEKWPSPAEKWHGHPNLRLRPSAPAKGNGRIQRQVRRAFLVAGKPVLSSSEVYRWVHPGKKAPGWLERWSVFTVLRTMCHQVGRCKPYGAWLWRLRRPLDEL
jgi:hypothetical protein